MVQEQAGNHLPYETPFSSSEAVNFFVDPNISKKEKRLKLLELSQLTEIKYGSEEINKLTALILTSYGQSSKSVGTSVISYPGNPGQEKITVKALLGMGAQLKNEEEIDQVMYQVQSELESNHLFTETSDPIQDQIHLQATHNMLLNGFLLAHPSPETTQDLVQ